MRPLVVIGCVVTVVAVVLGTRHLMRSDQEAAAPPFSRPQESGHSVPDVEDPRADPAFDEAYLLICGQTILEPDAMYAAASADAPDLTTMVDAHHRALTQRITSVYDRADLWVATDPLVPEYDETLAADLASILDGTEAGFDYLDGDVTLIRSPCDDWFAPA